MDGIIIGGGLAGLLCGIQAQARGKKTMLITEGVGSHSHMFGPLHFGDVARLKEQDHPYRLLGDYAERAVQAFFEHCPAYSGRWDKETEVINPLGHPVKTNLALKSMDAHAIYNCSVLYLISPTGLKDFFLPLIVRNLSSYYPKLEIEVVPFSPPEFEEWRKIGRSISPANYTNYLSGAKGRKQIKTLLSTIAGVARGKGQKADECGILFPCLVPDFDPELKEIIHQSEIPVITMPSFSPTGIGYKLNKALTDRYLSLGGEIVYGKALKGECKQGRCGKIVVKQAGRTGDFQGKEYILATGGILGGGIAVEKGLGKETVFGLPLYQKVEITKETFLGPQPYALTGVKVNEKLQPVDPLTGRVVLRNVRVIGRLLANFDPWIDHCGGGVSITSGYLAGELLGEGKEGDDLE